MTQHRIILAVQTLSAIIAAAILSGCGGWGPGTGDSNPPSSTPSINGTWILSWEEVRQGTEYGNILASNSYTTSQAWLVYQFDAANLFLFQRSSTATSLDVYGYTWDAVDSLLQYSDRSLHVWVESSQLATREVVLTDSGTVVVTRWFDVYSGTVPPLGWPQLSQRRADLYEVDDTYLDGTAISVSSAAQQHSIYPAGDIDYFTFAAYAGATYTITASGTDLRLYNTNGVTTLEYDPNGSLQWYCTVSGTYYFSAESPTADTVLWYSVRLTATGLPSVDPDTWEFDNDILSSNPISTNEQRTLTISPSGDVDLFSFSATQGVTYTIQTSGSLNTTIDLYASDRSTLLGTALDGGSGTNAKMTWTCLSSGTYFFSVEEFSVSVTGTYTVSVSATSATGTDDFEPDNSFSEAQSILVDAPPQSHRIDPMADYDYLVFTASAGTTYVIQTYGSTDTYLVLYGGDQSTRILESDDYAGSNAGAEWPCEVSGTYYVRINEFGLNDTGSYTIDVVAQ